MNPAFAFCKFVAKAALNCVGFGVAGEIVAEVVPEMAREVYRWWGKDRPQAQLRAEVEAVARLSDEEAQLLAQQIVLEVADHQPEDIKLKLLTYLAHVPAAIRQTQRRLGEDGRTLPGSLQFTGPADVLPLLPARLPRFRRGQRAPGFSDWELDELLGVGGFGEVWKATNPHLPPVALKFCLDAAVAGSLRNEADLLGRVARQGRHRGIVALLDTALSAEPPCLKYEFVPGGDLTALARAWHTGSAEGLVPRCLAVVAELAEAVAFAHRLEPPIVHRDLKPANVLFTADGSPRITDFGIAAIVARQLDAGVTTMRGRSLPSALRGSCTPLYASPQQLRGEPPDPRDDVFALGVIWFQILTGQLTERPGIDWRIELAEKRIPARMLDVMERCLASKAERRYADAAELAAALRAIDLNSARRDRSRVAVETALAELDGEDDTDTDDPFDLAAQIQKSLLRTQQTIAKAVELTETHHDYAGAVQLLERLPEPFRDNALLEAVRERRDRVERLRREVLAAAKAYHFAGLADRIDDLLELTPNDQEVLRLRGTVPWEPGAEVVNSIGMKLVLIQAGSFWMGAPQGESGRQRYEGPVHEVEISRRFHLGAHQVTQEQYQRVMSTNPSHFRVVPGHDTRRFPVESVSWEEAIEFCLRLSELPEERRRGRLYRLPTEAEWEYACRAGRPTQYPFHFGPALSGNEANFDGRHPYGHGHRGDFLQRTTAGGSCEANAWGLCDMHGNVWEWCQDWYDERTYRHSPRRDPQGPERGAARVLRGGSWQNHGRLCRAACRDWVSPGYHGLNVGFRVVLVVPANGKR